MFNNGPLSIRISNLGLETQIPYLRIWFNSPSTAPKLIDVALFQQQSAMSDICIKHLNEAIYPMLVAHQVVPVEDTRVPR